MSTAGVLRTIKGSICEHLRKNSIVDPKHGPNKFVGVFWRTSGLCVMPSFLSCVCAPLGGHVCTVPAADATEPGRIHVHHPDVAHPQLKK